MLVKRKKNAEVAAQRKEEQQRKEVAIRLEQQAIRDVLIECSRLEATADKPFPKLSKQTHLVPLAKALGMKPSKKKASQLIEELTKRIKEQGHDNICNLVNNYDRNEFIK